MKNLKILIANDDGIRSEGIAHLARAAAQFGSVWVAAPERQCSGMSVRLTISETSEMAVYRYDFPAPVEAAWSVDGTPADCVKVALRALLPFTPDVVLSGINDGMNAGLDVAYSGTVGAATEAALHGIPAIAVSMRDDKSFEVTSTSPPARFPIAAASCVTGSRRSGLTMKTTTTACARKTAYSTSRRRQLFFVRMR